MQKFIKVAKNIHVKISGVDYDQKHVQTVYTGTEFPKISAQQSKSS